MCVAALKPAVTERIQSTGSELTGKSVKNVLSFGAKQGDPGFNCRSAFQSAFAALANDGGGVLYVPKGEYYIDFPDIATDIDPKDPQGQAALRLRPLSRAKLLIVPPGVTLQGDTNAQGEPATQIHWKATSFPLLSFANSNNSGIKNVGFVFDGTQPHFFPWSQDQLLAAIGVSTSSLGGPHEISTVVYTIGSEGLVFENLTFSSGAKPADNEHTFGMGIVSKGAGPVPFPARQVISQLAVGARIPGPALTARVRGNVFKALKFSDFVCGILASGQENPVFEEITGNYRGSWYRSFDPMHEQPGHTDHLPGPGHLIYLSAQPVWEIARSVEQRDATTAIHSVVRNTNVTLRNITEGAETLSNFNSLGTLALKNIDGGTVRNVQSQHPAGLIVSMADVHNVSLQDLTWSSNRDLCSEPDAKLNCAMSVIQLVPESYPGLEGINDRLTFSNLSFRSPHWAAVFKVAAVQTQDLSKMNQNIVVDGLTIACSAKVHNGQTTPRGIIEVQASDIHFKHVTYTPIVEAGSASTILDNACQIWPKSVNVTIDIMVHLAQAFPSASAPIYKCLMLEHPAPNASTNANGCSITEHVVR